MALSKRKSRTTGSTGRGSSGSTGRTIHSSTGISAHSTQPSVPIQTSPLGLGFGSQPSTQSVDSKDGYFVGTWQHEVNIPVDKINTNYIDFLVQLLSQHHVDAELQSLIIQQLLQQGANNEQRSYDYALTQDQRQYDWNLLQDSRLYNNPQNELARLMGAGISRDAAIQILSGAAGNAGGVAGASPIVSSPSQVPMPDTFGNQSLATAQTALQGVQMVANLVSQGIDAATAVNQAQMIRAQNYMTQSQLQAFKGVNDISQAFDRAVFDGTLTVEDVQGLRTADDYYKWITDHAETNMIKPLIQSGAVNAAFGSTFGRQMMNHHLDETRKGRDSGVVYDEFVKSQMLDNALTAVNINKVGAEMELIGTQNKLTEQQIIESCNRVAVGEAQIQLMNKEGDWIDIQGVQLVRKTDAEVDLMGSQSYLTNAEAEQVRLNYEYNSAGFPMMKQTRILQCQDELLKWRCYTDKEGRKQRMRLWLQEPQNAADAAYLQAIHNDAVGDFATYYPNLWILSEGFQAAGVNDLLRTGAQGTVAGTGILKLVPK